MSSAPLLRRIAAFVAATLAFVGISALYASPASAAGVGYVRLAHLVPDGPPCDMYIYLNSVSGEVQRSLPAVAYGTVSSYQSLPTGTYAVAMRKPGADPASPPVLSAQLTVAEGRGYTVGRVGTQANVKIITYEDDLTLPEGDKAKLRVIQASLRTLDVGVAGGSSIANGVAFSTTTAYQQIAPGSVTLSVKPAGGQESTLPATLSPGNVYSLIVLEGPGGGVKAELRTDAKRDGGVPSGGVETGAGGSARVDPIPAMFGALSLALLGVGLFALRARRHRLHRAHLGS